MSAERSDALDRVVNNAYVAWGFTTCLVTMSEWVHRRVETVTFTDADRILRHTSVDFTAPSDLPRGDQMSQTLVPIAYLSKGPITSLDVRDAAGDAVPVLTAHQNSLVAEEALLALAWSTLFAHAIAQEERDAVPRVSAAASEIRHFLNPIVREAPTEARKEFDELASILTQRRVDGDLLGTLVDSGGFLDLTDTFVDNFILVAVAHAPVGERHLLKFRYVERSVGVDDSRPRREKLFDALGLSPQTFSVGLPGANRASSYHVELRVPDGVGITEAVLVDADGKFVAAKPDRKGRPAVHLLAPQDIGQTCKLEFNLRAMSGGWLRSSFAAVTIVFLLLWFSALRLDALTSDGNLGDADTSRGSVDTPALLLGFVGVIGTFVVRSGEHALTARLLVWARGITMAAVGLPFVAAWLLVFGPDGRALEQWWETLTAIAFGVSVLLLCIIRGPKPFEYNDSESAIVPDKGDEP